MCIIKCIQLSEILIIYKDVTCLEHLGAVAITTVQLISVKLGIKFYADSNPTCGAL